jgi:hypothetical protein
VWSFFQPHDPVFIIGFLNVIEMLKRYAVDPAGLGNLFQKFSEFE